MSSTILCDLHLGAQLSRIFSRHISASATSTTFGNLLNTVSCCARIDLPRSYNRQYRHSGELRHPPIGSLPPNCWISICFRHSPPSQLLSSIAPAERQRCVSGVQREIVIIEQLVLGTSAIQYPIRFRGFLKTFNITRRDDLRVHMAAIVNVTFWSDISHNSRTV